jgi:thioredoxin-disulfide reductase
MFDLIIIGGGPAGITAGIYASRQKLKTLLITKDFGGQIARKTVPVENWPGNIRISGKNLIKNFENHLNAYEIEIYRDEVATVKKKNKIFEVKTEGKKKFIGKSVIVATGADPRPLEIPGEKEFIGRGVSYCVLCDGAFYKDKTVAVIGGGNSAMEAVLFLANYAKKIYALEYQKEIPAFEDLQAMCLATKKAKFITNADTKEIKGDKLVKEITYTDRNSKKEKNLKIDGIFIEIGNSPATAFVKELVSFNKYDEIIADCKTCSTKTSGLFAAGDVTDVFPKQIVIAAAEGAKASISAYKYLKQINVKKNNS